MRNKGCFFFLTVIGVALFVFNTPAFSFNDTRESRETLRGVTPVYVVIEGITPELEQNGMSAKQLKTAVEKQLSKAGINVIATAGERKSAASFPAGLYVSINALKSDTLKSGFDIDYYAISISVELMQRCLALTHESLSRVSENKLDPLYISSHASLACTWSASNIYLAGEERLIDIRDCVKELVGYFIESYVSVNLSR
jgi:hypothetical protein